MLRLGSILCPVDFSDESRRALRWASMLAARYGSRLTVLNAVDPLLSRAAMVRLNLDLAKSETGPALQEFVRETLPDRPPQLATAVVVGDAADAIAAAQNTTHADLTVMGTHGLGGFRKLVLGSTAEHVLRHTRSAVLTVPPTDPGTSNGGGADIKVDRVLTATDFSDASASALAWAADLARQMAASLIVVHVVTPMNVPPQWRSYAETVDDDLGASAKGRLETFVGALKEERAGTERVVAVGAPAEAIASLAEERHAGLIVMGLSGQGGALAPRPGSIAYRVLGRSHVPVLVVPA